jgi:ribosomal protein L37AE/L43A
MKTAPTTHTRGRQTEPVPETFAPCPKCGGLVFRRVGVWGCHDGCGWPDRAGHLEGKEREMEMLASLAERAHVAAVEAEARHRVAALALAELKTRLVADSLAPTKEGTNP